MYRSRRHQRRSARPAGFTLVEVAVAIVVLGTLCTSVLVVFDRCVAAVIDLQSRTIAFEMARENMEQVLAADYVVEKVEFGVHPLHQGIEWQTTIEHFNEPITDRMWIRAVCSASYLDADNERQTVELTHWITDLSDRQAQALLEQERMTDEYMDLLGENEEYLAEQRAVRRYLSEMGLDVEGYDELLLRQKQEKELWIAQNDFDPDAFKKFLEQLQEEEYQWLIARGFSPDDYGNWRIANPQYLYTPGESGDPYGPGESPTDPLDPSKPDDPTSPRDPDAQPEPGQDTGTGLTPELRQKLKEKFNWTDEQIDRMFGGGS